MSENLREVLITRYGTQIEKDIELVIEKLNKTIAAHCYAGDIGENPLCKLNRAFMRIE